jgi:hypothetical protein
VQEKRGNDLGDSENPTGRLAILWYKTTNISVCLGTSGLKDRRQDEIRMGDVISPLFLVKSRILTLLLPAGIGERCTNTIYDEIYSGNAKVDDSNDSNDSSNSSNSNTPAAILLLYQQLIPSGC